MNKAAKSGHSKIFQTKDIQRSVLICTNERSCQYTRQTKRHSNWLEKKGILAVVFTIPDALKNLI